MSAPHTSRGWHCVDAHDVMCYSDSPYFPDMHVLCPDGNHENRLDCNHDDYFHTNPPSGSYLASHWNVANNRFLIAGPDTVQPAQPTLTLDPASGPIGEAVTVILSGYRANQKVTIYWFNGKK